MREAPDKAKRTGLALSCQPPLGNALPSGWRLSRTDEVSKLCLSTAQASAHRSLDRWSLPFLLGLGSSPRSLAGCPCLNCGRVGEQADP
jgi:hypothetical protein